MIKGFTNITIECGAAQMAARVNGMTCSITLSDEQIEFVLAQIDDDVIMRYLERKKARTDKNYALIKDSMAKNKEMVAAAVSYE